MLPYVCVPCLLGFRFLPSPHVCLRELCFLSSSSPAPSLPSSPAHGPPTASLHLSVFTGRILVHCAVGVSRSATLNSGLPHAGTTPRGPSRKVKDHEASLPSRAANAPGLGHNAAGLEAWWGGRSGQACGVWIPAGQWRPGAGGGETDEPILSLEGLGHGPRPQLLSTARGGLGRVGWAGDDHLAGSWPGRKAAKGPGF